MVQQHGLTWGIFDFVDKTPTADGYVAEAIADGTDFGKVESEYELVQSLLRDGALSVRGKRKNRTITIRLRFSAPSVDAGPALAAAEKALMLQAGMDQPPPLAYTPAATDAVTSFYDVVIAEDPEWDSKSSMDLEEAMCEHRYFTLTLQVLPFARPESTVVSPAIAIPPPSPTTASIDTCDSLTGWTSSATISQASGYVQAAQATNGGINDFTLTRTGSVTMGATPYLRLTIESVLWGSGFGESAVTPDALILGIGSSTFDPLATAPSSTVAGATDYYFQPSASFSAFIIKVGFPAAPTGRQNRLRVHQVSRTDTIPGSGTARQQSRTVTVGGSAPTQAAIRLFDATPAALGGEVLVYSSRNTTLRPALRPFRFSSATVTGDAARVSGSRNPLGSAMVFRIPARSFTQGLYSLMALMNVTTTGTLTWSVRTVTSAGATTVGSSIVTSGTVVVPVTTGYQILNLAAIPLPVINVEGDQMVELTISGSANMTIDEGWLFSTDDGVLTWIRDAESLSWIEIRSPELGAPLPSIYGGTGAKGVSGVDVSWKAAGVAGGISYGAFGTHRFEPGLMQIFTVCTGSLLAQSEIESYWRYLSHVEGAAA